VLRKTGTLAVLLASLTGAACAPAVSGAADQPSPRVSAERAAELEALYRARVERDRQRFTEADVRFMTDMIVHHGQALVMAGLAPERADGQPIRVLAARIENAQRDEIGLMQRWLRDRGREAPEIHVSGSALHVFTTTGHAHHDHSGMPGMLTQAQLDELAAANGRDFDRLFLTYMIEHHRGAMVMVRELLGADGAAQDPELFRFASDVHVDQATEIARMERMLAAMAGSHPGR
jgi:uncharacterized protein (DUF305 family)